MAPEANVIAEPVTAEMYGTLVPVREAVAALPGAHVTAGAEAVHAAPHVTVNTVPVALGLP